MCFCVCNNPVFILIFFGSAPKIGQSGYPDETVVVKGLIRCCPHQTHHNNTGLDGGADVGELLSGVGYYR